MEAIKYKIELKTGEGDGRFLNLLNKYIPLAIEEFKPDFILYNAGTDCLESDPLGSKNSF